ncbi:hypothetical protein FOFC_18577 [Fusarium oxysporum]|nr:hypothetical protein FOFC_18577 [Fusarium oxysporum]
MRTIQDLIKQVKAKGFILTKVKPYLANNNTTRFIATETIKKGDIVLQVPYKSAHTTEDISAEIKDKYPDCSAQSYYALEIAKSIRKKERNVWCFLDEVPDKLLRDSIITWPDSLIQALPKQTIRSATDLRAAYKDDWRETESSQKKGGLDIEQEEFKQAWIVAQTRMLACEGSNGEAIQAMLPLAEMFNHASDGCHLDFADNFYEFRATRDYNSGEEDLRRLCWKAPHEEDLFALSCVVDTNKRHLEALELDFIEWDTSAGRSFRYGNGTPDVCPLLGDVLHLSPIAGGAIFPKLQELSLSEAAIGPKLALAIDFNVLRVLKLRGCYGWCEFLEHLTASRVKLEITTFELIAAGDKSPAVEIRDDTINEFLASFTGLQELYLLVSAPWFPCGQFSSAIANHRATLRQCVLDGLWENIPEEPERRMLAAPFGEGFLGILDLQAIGLINDHHTLVCMSG